MDKTRSKNITLLVKILFGSIAIVLPTVILLIYLVTKPAFIANFNLSDTGEIGDTIGGITAPLFNFIAAILIFTSFKEQVKENNRQATIREDEADITHIDSLLNQISIELQSFTVEINEYNDEGTAIVKSKKYSGVEAFNEFSNYLLNDYLYPHNSMKVINHDFYSLENLTTQAHYILSSLTLIIKTIKNNPSTKKNLLTHRLHGYYFIKLKYGLNNLVRYQMNNIENERPIISNNFIEGFKKVDTFFSQIKFN